MEKESAILILVMVGIFGFIGFAALQSGFIETELSGVLLQDGSTPLTANWDAGSFNITADYFLGNILGSIENADKLDNMHAVEFIWANGSNPLTADWTTGENIIVSAGKQIIVTTDFVRNVGDTNYIALWGSSVFDKGTLFKIGADDQTFALLTYWDGVEIQQLTSAGNLYTVGSGYFASNQWWVEDGSGGARTYWASDTSQAFYVENYEGTFRWVNNGYSSVVASIDQTGASWWSGNLEIEAGNQIVVVTDFVRNKYDTNYIGLWGSSSYDLGGFMKIGADDSLWAMTLAWDGVPVLTSWNDGDLEVLGEGRFISNNWQVVWAAGSGARTYWNGADNTDFYIENQNGTLRFVNDNYAAIKLTLDQSGNLDIEGTLTVNGAFTFTSSGIIYGVDTSTNIFLDSAGDFVARDTDLGTTNFIWYDKSESDLFLGTTAIDTKMRGNLYLQSYLLSRDGTGKFLESTYSGYDTIELYRETDGDIGFYDRTDAVWLVRYDMTDYDALFPEDVAADTFTLNTAHYQLTTDYRFGVTVLGILNTGTNEDSRIGLNPSGTADASGFYLYNSGSSSDVGRINFILTGDTLTMSAQNWLTGTLPTEFRISGLKLGFAAGEYIEISDTNHLDLYADTSIDLNAHADTTYMMGTLTAGSQTGTAGGTTRYLSFSISNVNFAVENEARTSFSKATTVRNMRFVVYSNSCTGSSTVTIRKNSGSWADTSITQTVGAATTGEYSDITNSASFNATDDISVEVTAGGTGSIVISSVIVECY